LEPPHCNGSFLQTLKIWIKRVCLLYLLTFLFSFFYSIVVVFIYFFFIVLLHLLSHLVVLLLVCFVVLTPHLLSGIPTLCFHTLLHLSIMPCCFMSSCIAAPRCHALLIFAFVPYCISLLHLVALVVAPCYPTITALPLRVITLPSCITTLPSCLANLSC